MHKIETTSFNWLPYKTNRDTVIKNLYRLSGRVVDLGCGTAPYKDDIIRAGCEYIGVDWENSLHDQKDVDVKCDICSTLPFEDGFADTVVSFQVMEHLPKPMKFLEECARILRPGGSLFITVPFQ